jgi:hypothetical protein
MSVGDKYTIEDTSYGSVDNHTIVNQRPKNVFTRGNAVLNLFLYAVVIGKSKTKNLQPLSRLRMTLPQSSLIRTAILSTIIVFSVSNTFAQDSFEVQVYESDLVPVNQYELDIHNIFVGHGNTSWDGTVAPSNHQQHLAFEITRGMTDYFEMGSYLLLAHRPDGASEYAGFRLRPRVKAPDDWGLPIGASLSVEIGFPQLQYEPNHVTLEIRPIIDKTIGRWKFDINPIMTFAFNGPEASQGMGLEPEGMIAYEIVPEQLRLMLEYYTALGPVRKLLPANEQVQLLYPKIEYAFSEFFTVNAGVGTGLTSSSDALTWAMRLTFSF